MIEAKEKQALADLVAIVNSLDLPMMLVGAGARLLIFDREFGEGRATKDWDVAISIDSWQAYEQLRQALIEGEDPRFQGTRNSHKFKHIETKIEVDIVPFGKIGEPNAQITWPDNKNGNSMNILGFMEAFSSAETMKIDKNWEIKVVKIPGLIVLKVFAWGDRGASTQKDLEDIDFILSRYQDSDPDRVYKDMVDELGCIPVLQ